MGTEPENARVLAGRYRLQSRLGRGGMGIVWRARDELLSRTVAVKEVAFDETLSPDEARQQRDRTLREARAVAGLGHPHIVVVHDVIEADERPFIVMELIDGGSLAERIARSGPVDADEAARIGIALLGALRKAHASGVLHRDLKPANVLIEAGTGRVVLTDFGIAQVSGATTLTETGSFVGSPEYTAPERMSASRTGPESDLWSLGALLCAALSGSSPFHRDSLGGVLHAVVFDEIRPPAQAEPLLPVVRGLLERDPDLRLDAEQAERMLRAFADTGRTPRVGPGRPSGLHDAIRRHTPHRAPRDQVPEDRTDGHAADAAGADGAPGDAGTPGRESPSQAAPGQATPSQAAPSQAAPGQVAPDHQTSGGAGPGGKASREAAPGDEASGGTASGPGRSPDDWPIEGRSAAGAADGNREPGSAAPRRRAPQLLVAGALVAAVAGAGVSAAALLTHDGLPGLRTPGDSASRTAQSGAPASGATESGRPHTGTSAPGGAGPSGGPTAGDSPTAPAGYHLVRDPEGFTLAVPDTFERETQGPRIFYKSPSGAFRIGIKEADPEPGGPLAVMRRSAAKGPGTNPGYRDGSVTATTHHGRPAARWEFTWNGFTAAEGARHTYDLCWEQDGRMYDIWVSAPVGHTTVAERQFDTAVATFTRTARKG